MSCPLTPGKSEDPIPRQIRVWMSAPPERTMSYAQNGLPDALPHRTLPKMTLSTEHNPLTSKLPEHPDSMSRKERAFERFAVKGNVLVTGGAGALGLWAGKALIEHGASRVVFWDRSQEAVDRIEVMTSENVASTMVGDLLTPGVIEDKIKTVFEKLGGLDHLLCFAGKPDCTPSSAVTTSNFQHLLDINLTAHFTCAREAFQYIKQDSPSRGPGGSILFIASISGHATNYPQPQVAYNAAKAGIISMTKSLAAEWAVHGVRVNCISPGYFDTSLNEGPGLQEAREIWASRCPMGRMGDEEEVTGAVVLLCSERGGRYITGTDIVIDGGALCF